MSRRPMVLPVLLFLVFAQAAGHAAAGVSSSDLLPGTVCTAAEKAVAPSKRYFDFIEAPGKEFVLVPRAGHDPNQLMMDAQYRVLKERVGDCR